jgi:hypothetical protein
MTFKKGEFTEGKKERPPKEIKILLSLSHRNLSETPSHNSLSEG